MPLKKTAPKAKTTKKIKRTVPHTKKRTAKTTESLFIPFTVTRIVLVASCLVLFLFAFVFVAKPNMTQSVAGVTVARGLFAQATVSIPNINGALYYNIYYKEKNSSEKDRHFPHAVRKIPPTVSSYTISYLKKNKQYEYKISAVDIAGKEFWWSGIKTLTNIQPM